LLTAPYSQLGSLADRYQSQTVLIAEAVMGEDAGVPKLDVNLRSLGLGGGGNELTLNYTARVGENPDELMIRAAMDVIEKLMLEEGGTTQASVQPTHKVTVLTKLDQLHDWVVVRKRLLALPNVAQVELSAISSQQADIVLHFEGTPDLLLRSMTSQGLQVQQAYNYWVVTF